MSEEITKEKLIDLDLDVLTDEYKSIRFGGKEIKVYPPDTLTLIKYTKWIRKYDKIMQEAQGMAEETENKEGKEKYDAIVDSRLDEVIEAVGEIIGVVIPELKDKKLNMRQYLALFDIINQLAVPADMEEMQKQGIEVSTDEKKTHSDTPKK